MNEVSLGKDFQHADPEWQKGLAELLGDKDIHQKLGGDDISSQRGVVGKFLCILQALYNAKPDEFDKVLSVKGRTRIYFSRSRKGLEEVGSSTNPKEITGTGFWVVTNSNTDRKRSILFKAAKTLGYDKPTASRIADALFVAEVDAPV